MEDILIQYGAMGAVMVWLMYRFEGKIQKVEEKLDKLDGTLDRLTNVLSAALGTNVKQDTVYINPTDQVGPMSQFAKKVL